MDFNLKDKKVFISGSSRGIGLSIAKRLIEEASKSGADYVKFQTYDLEKIIIKNTKATLYQSEPQAFREIACNHASFLFTNYSDIFNRILKDELGLRLKIFDNKSVKNIGFYEHLYEDNFLGNNDF